MKFAYKVGAVIPVSADVAGNMCKQLERTVGLTAQNLLDANRAEDAPLHSAFEWNDVKAAESYRLNQAAYIIRSLVTVEDEKSAPVRAFFTVERKIYESIDEILADRSKTEDLLKIALRELKAFKAKYSQLIALSGVFDAIDHIPL